jgi:hypothetical protein
MAKRFQKFGSLLLGVCLGAAGYAALSPGERPAVAEPQPPVPDLATMAGELEVIRGKLPDQAHAMQDVSYHFANLWFSGDAGNWPLADFYWKETRSHLQWAVRIIPVRKDNADQPVDLVKILQAFETTPLEQLRAAIEERDREKFAIAYRVTLEGCYTCHKASDKPFIRPQMPTEPESRMVNFDPKATWPK